MKKLYETNATASAGRNGKVSSDDGLLSLALSYPKEMGGVGKQPILSSYLRQAIAPVSLMPYYM